MKKIMVIVLLVLIFSGCYLNQDTVFKTAKTFEAVSDPYRNQYGPPEDINNYQTDGYTSISWWWWTKGFNVVFVNSAYDNTDGWRVDSTYSFTPIN